MFKAHRVKNKQERRGASFLNSITAEVILSGVQRPRLARYSWAQETSACQVAKCLSVGTRGQRGSPPPRCQLCRVPSLAKAALLGGDGFFTNSAASVHYSSCFIRKKVQPC